MDLLERAKQKLKEQESIKEEPVKEDLKPIKIEEKQLLHPPKAPPITPKPISKASNGKPGIKIDWNKVAQSSDFKRAVYLALEGKTFRGSNEKLEKELNKKVQVFRDPNFSNLVKDLKKHFESGLLKPSQINNI